MKYLVWEGLEKAKGWSHCGVQKRTSAGNREFEGKFSGSPGQTTVQTLTMCYRGATLLGVKD